MAVIIIILLFLLPLPASGKGFNTHWIYAPQADSSSYVWFRRAYFSKGRPRQAAITVTTAGYYKLYVNECNVGTALFYPFRQQGDTSAVETFFDITPYLRNDTNVVALLCYRPVSATIYGIAHDGTKFSYVTDGTWLCRRSNSCKTSDGGELTDGRRHDPSWKAATIYNLAMWAQAEPMDESGMPPSATGSYAAWSIAHIDDYTPADFSLTADSVTSLQLPYGFYGFLRATIREARKGERITIGNIHYICNGTIDEQAFPQFYPSYWRTIPITGDKRFRPSQIMNLETVGIQKQRMQSF